MECSQPQHIPSVFRKIKNDDSFEEIRKTDSCTQTKFMRRKKGISSCYYIDINTPQCIIICLQL